MDRQEFELLRVFDPHNFYLRETNPAISFEKFQDMLNERCSKSRRPLPDSISTGAIVAVPSSDRNWYRGEVVKTFVSNNSLFFRCFLLDTAESVTITRKRCTSLEPSLAAFAYFAIHCRLRFLKPVSLDFSFKSNEFVSMPSDSWDGAAVSLMKELLEEEFTVRFLGDKIHRHCQNDVEILIGNTTLSNVLIEKKFAIFCPEKEVCQDKYETIPVISPKIMTSSPVAEKKNFPKPTVYCQDASVTPTFCTDDLNIDERFKMKLRMEDNISTLTAYCWSALELKTDSIFIWRKQAKKQFHFIVPHLISSSSIIICSNAATLYYVHDLINQFDDGGGRHYAIDSLNDISGHETSILNGYDSLVVTPATFLQLFTKLNVTGNRIVLFDAVDCLYKHHGTIKRFFTLLSERLAKYQPSLATRPLVLFIFRKINQAIIEFYSKFTNSNRTVIFSSCLDIALSRNVLFKVHFVDNGISRNQGLLSILESGLCDNMSGVVVVTVSNTESKCLHKIINCTLGIYVTVTSFLNMRRNAFRMMIIYDWPEGQTLLSHLENCVRNNDSIQCVYCLINTDDIELLKNDELETFFDMESTDAANMAAFKKQAIGVSESKRMHKELCPRLKMFGRCSQYSIGLCDYRHHLNPNVTTLLPPDGTLTFRVSYVINPSQFYAFYVSHSSGTFFDFFEEETSLQLYFSSRENRKIASRVTLNGLYAWRDKGNIFRRVKVRALQRNKNNVVEKIRIFLIDVGSEYHIPPSDLYSLPEQFQLYSPAVVECIVCFISPLDGDETWNVHSSVFAHKHLHDKCMEAKIAFSAESTVWLYAITENLTLTGLNLVLQDQTFKALLIKEGLSNDNPFHIKAMKGHFAIADDDSVVLAEKKEEKCSLVETRTIEKMQFPRSCSVCVTAVVSPNEIYVRRADMSLQFKEMNDVIDYVVKTAKPMSNGFIGKYCFVYSDSLNRWVRGEVINTNPIKVFALDYGEILCPGTCDIRELSIEALPWSCFASCFKLYGLLVNDNSTGYKFDQSKTYVMEFVNDSAQVCLIDLSIPSLPLDLSLVLLKECSLRPTMELLSNFCSSKEEQDDKNLDDAELTSLSLCSTLKELLLNSEFDKLEDMVNRLCAYAILWSRMPKRCFRSLLHYLSFVLCVSANDKVCEAIIDKLFPQFIDKQDFASFSFGFNVIMRLIITTPQLKASALNFLKSLASKQLKSFIAADELRIISVWLAALSCNDESLLELIDVKNILFETLSEMRKALGESHCNSKEVFEKFLRGKEKRLCVESDEEIMVEDTKFMKLLLGENGLKDCNLDESLKFDILYLNSVFEMLHGSGSNNDEKSKSDEPFYIPINCVPHDSKRDYIYPQVLWYQSLEHVLLFVSVMSNSPQVFWNDHSISFRCISNNQKYGFNIRLFSNIAKLAYKIMPTGISIKVEKMEKIEWPRLQLRKKKFHFIHYDTSKLQNDLEKQDDKQDQERPYAFVNENDSNRCDDTSSEEDDEGDDADEDIEKEVLFED